jgi:hypothetical protein
VAVKIIDMLGEEVLVTQVLSRDLERIAAADI